MNTFTLGEQGLYLPVEKLYVDERESLRVYLLDEY